MPISLSVCSPLRPLHGMWSFLAVCSAVGTGMLLSSTLEYRRNVTKRLPAGIKEHWSLASSSGVSFLDLFLPVCGTVASFVLYIALEVFNHPAFSNTRASVLLVALSLALASLGW